LTQGSLYAHGKEFTPGNVIARPLSRGGAKVSIVAGEQNLQKVVVVQFFVAIEIEVADKADKVFWLEFSEAILTLKLAK
jgi:hypothetical protein